MPIQSMQCPKCGTWATEYDSGKWQCMSHRCGVKFVYEKPTLAPVVNNTFINMEAGDVLQDLDVAAKQYHTPVYLTPSWKVGRQIAFSIFFTVFVWLVGSVIGFVKYDTPSQSWGGSYSLIGNVLWISVWLFFMLKVHYDTKKAANAKVLIGIYTTCPHCRVNEYSIQPGFVEQTLRCKNCGKSYYADEEASYPLLNASIPQKQHSSSSAQQGVVPLPVVVEMPLTPPPIPPMPKPPMIECPFCSRAIPKSSVFVGVNTCPFCQNQFEAELGDRV